MLQDKVLVYWKQNGASQLQQVFFSLWRHKIRSALALFGIIWGTVAVILLLAIANGFYTANQKNLAFLNGGTVFAWGGKTSKPYQGSPPGQSIHLRITDLLAIVENVPQIKLFSPIYFLSNQHENILSYQDKQTAATIQGVNADQGEMQSLIAFPGGRFIDAFDVAERHRVVFLDNEIKLSLFGTENAVGKIIMIEGVPFLIIGIADPAHKNILIHMTKSIYVPYTTFLSLWGPKDIDFFFVQPTSSVHTAALKQSIKNMMARKHHFDPGDEQALMMPDTEDLQLFFQWFFRIIEIFFGVCGALTLSVGGLGIANMMFLIVTERTREIGLRMALGAGPVHIMTQFMLETLLLVGSGGVIGFILAGSCLQILQQLPLPEWLGTPHTSWTTIMITLSILLSVGALAGYFPARRAANMQPVQALAF
jgi:putative ABC transport system permease protein